MLTSAFAISTPPPSWSTLLTTSSTYKYWTLASSLSMPSFTLLPSGADRFTISLHLPGFPFLGMTPNWLHCTLPLSTDEDILQILLALSSFAKYSSIIALCSIHATPAACHLHNTLIMAQVEACTNAPHKELHPFLVRVLLQFSLPFLPLQWRHHCLRTI